MPVDASDSSPPDSTPEKGGRTAESSPEDRREHGMSPEAEEFIKNIVVDDLQWARFVTFVLWLMNLASLYIIAGTSYVGFFGIVEYVSLIGWVFFIVLMVLVKWIKDSLFAYNDQNVDQSPMPNAGRGIQTISKLAGSTPQRRERTRRVVYVLKRVCAGTFLFHAVFYGWVYIQASADMERPLYALWNASLEWFASLSLVRQLVLVALPIITVGYTIYKFAPRP